MNSKQARIASKAPISTHRAFVPLIAVWLATLACGSIAVLPPAVFEMHPAPLDLAMTQMAMTGCAALLGAGSGWAAGRVFQALQARASQRHQAVSGDVAEPAFEPVTPLTIAELEAASEPEDVAAEVPIGAQENPVSLDQASALDEAPALVEPFEDTQREPYYADITLDDLLGAPRTEWQLATEQVEDAVFEPVVEAAVYPEPETIHEPETALEAAPQPKAEPEPAPRLRQHGKAVNLLRTHATRELAMPQLIERFAVALDDHRKTAQQASHSYSYPARPAHMAEPLRKLADGAQPVS